MFIGVVRLNIGCPMIYWKGKGKESFLYLSSHSQIFDFLPHEHVASGRLPTHLFTYEMYVSKCWLNFCFVLLLNLFSLLCLLQSLPASSWKNNYELPPRRLDISFISYIKLLNTPGLHKCGIICWSPASCWCKCRGSGWYGYLNGNVLRN